MTKIVTVLCLRTQFIMAHVVSRTFRQSGESQEVTVDTAYYS